jgi:hypothetical protein
MIEIEGVGEISLFEVKVIESGGFDFEVDGKFIGGLFDF